MPSAPYDITVPQGDDYIITLRIKLDSGAYENLSGRIGKSQIRVTAASADIAAEFAVVIPDQSVLANLGTLILTLTSVQSALLPVTGAVWDVQTSLPNATGVVTRMGGKVNVLAQVTR